jgi:hypothetical protein
MATRYWVGGNGITTWEGSAVIGMDANGPIVVCGWAQTSGGAPMRVGNIPGSNDIAIFDGNSNVNCTVAISKTVGAINATSGFTHTLTVAHNCVLTLEGNSTSLISSWEGGTLKLWDDSGDSELYVSHASGVTGKLNITGGSIDGGSLSINGAYVSLGGNPTLFTPAVYVGYTSAGVATWSGSLEVSSSMSSTLNLAGKNWYNTGTVQLSTLQSVGKLTNGGHFYNHNLLNVNPTNGTSIATNESDFVFHNEWASGDTTHTPTTRIFTLANLYSNVTATVNGEPGVSFCVGAGVLQLDADSQIMPTGDVYVCEEVPANGHSEIRINGGSSKITSLAMDQGILKLSYDFATNGGLYSTLYLYNICTITGTAEVDMRVQGTGLGQDKIWVDRAADNDAALNISTSASNPTVLKVITEITTNNSQKQYALISNTDGPYLIATIIGNFYSFIDAQSQSWNKYKDLPSSAICINRP